MIVATFNINGIRARLEALGQWAGEASPDILCLQETKCPDDKFPADEVAAMLGYEVHHGQKSYNGVAILSRREPDEWIAGLDNGASPEEEARLILARFGDVWVLNTYVPQGREVGCEMFDYKLAWYDRVGAMLGERFDPSRDKLVWVGDLNVALDDRDVYDPDRLRGGVCFHPDEQAALARVMDWGLVDLFRKHEPGEKQFSFFDYRLPKSVQRKLGWRIDHVLATPPMAERSKKAWIDLSPRTRPKPSDHTPVLVEFDV